MQLPSLLNSNLIWIVFIVAEMKSIRNRVNEKAPLVLEI